MRAHLALGVLLALLAVGCDAFTYEPKGEHFVEVAPPDSSHLTVYFSGGNDTLRVWGNGISIRFNLDVDDDIVESASFYYNDRLFLTTQPTAASGTLQFNSRSFPDGFGVLTIKAKVRSNDESLASQAGKGEVFEIEARQVVQIENAAPQALPLTVEKKNGTISIQWSAYTKYNFVEYRLYRNWYNANELLVVYTDPNQTEYFDTEFIGTNIYNTNSYRLVLVAAEEAVSEVVFDDDGPQLVETKNVNGNVLLSWTPTAFPSNLKDYKILRYFELYYSAPPETIATITDPSTTTYIDTTDVIGGGYKYELVTSSLSYSVSTSLGTGTIGHSVPYGSLYGFSSGLNKYQFFEDGCCGQYSAIILADPQILQGTRYDITRYTSFSLTNDGTHFFATTSAGSSYNGLVYQGNIPSFNTIDTFDISTHLDNGEWINIKTVTDDNILIADHMVYKSPATYGQGVMGIDLKTNRLLFKAKRVGVNRNGRYALGGVNQLFETDPWRELFRQLPYDIAQFLKDDEFITQRGTTINIYKLPNLDLITTYSVPPNFRLYALGYQSNSAVDEQNDLIALSKEIANEPYECKVYDLYSGTEIYTARTGLPCSLHNRTIWSGSYYRSIPTHL